MSGFQLLSKDVLSYEAEHFPTQSDDVFALKLQCVCQTIAQEPTKVAERGTFRFWSQLLSGNRTSTC